MRPVPLPRPHDPAGQGGRPEPGRAARPAVGGAGAILPDLQPLPAELAAPGRPDGVRPRAVPPAGRTLDRQGRQAVPRAGAGVDRAAVGAARAGVRQLHPPRPDRTCSRSSARRPSRSSPPSSSRSTPARPRAPSGPPPSRRLAAVRGAGSRAGSTRRGCADVLAAARGADRPARGRPPARVAAPDDRPVARGVRPPRGGLEPEAGRPRREAHRGAEVPPRRGRGGDPPARRGGRGDPPAPRAALPGADREGRRRLRDAAALAGVTAHRGLGRARPDRACRGSPTSAREAFELLENYPKWRFQSLLLQHLAASFVGVRGHLSDQLREVNFCRVRLGELARLFEEPAEKPAPTPSSHSPRARRAWAGSSSSPAARTSARPSASASRRSRRRTCSTSTRGSRRC